MQMLARLALSVSVLGLLLGAACFTRPAWMARMNLDVWELPELLSWAEQERQREAELNDLATTLLGRMELKEQVQKELIAGRVSLTGAAARYRRLVPPTHYFWDHLRCTYPSMSDSESLCQYLVDCALLAVRDHPERGQVQARLRAELAELRCGDSVLQ
ncbi:MAG: hypothetical protein L0Z62_43835 [Gemmataceae bacterium]|nr:hypothetical protein [Gemmataceae bacterium]